MNVIRDIITPIVKIANKANLEKVEYEEKENGVKIWIYGDVNEDVMKQIVSLQYALIRKYQIGIEIVVIPISSYSN
jgi:hypothetical protein